MPIAIFERLPSKTFQADSETNSPPVSMLSLGQKVLLEKDILVEEQLQARAHEFATGQRHHVG